MRLTIDRSKWDRGNDGGFLACEGQLCALGFYLHATGVPLWKLERRHHPEQVPFVEPDARLGEVVLGYGESGLIENLWIWSPTLTEKIMYINDAPNLDDGAREAELIQVFESIGVELEFIG